MKCVCGCGKRRAHDHHVVAEQAVRRAYRELARAGKATWRSEAAAVADRRNLVPIAFGCHGDHHAIGIADRRLLLRVLPDSVFEFAGELLGPGRAYEYLRRRYQGDDPRLQRLLEAWEAIAE